MPEVAQPVGSEARIETQAAWLVIGNVADLATALLVSALCTEQEVIIL